jgi:hypothetical protein
MDSSIANLQVGIVGVILVSFLLLDHFTEEKNKRLRLQHPAATGKIKN